MDMEIRGTNSTYYTVLPSKLRYSKQLNFAKKVILSEIVLLSSKNGACTASNEYFAELYDVDERTIRRWIHTLKNLNIIKINILKGNKRVIKLDKILNKKLLDKVKNVN